MAAAPVALLAAWRRVVLPVESLVVRRPVVTLVVRPQAEWQAATREALQVEWPAAMPAAPPVE